MRLFRPGSVLMSTTTLLVGLQFGASGADTSLEATLARIDKAAATFKGLRADLRKVSHLDLINEDTVDTGTIVVKVPKPHDSHILIDLKQPDAKRVLIGATKVEFYTPQSNVVTEYDLTKENRAMAEQGLLLGFGSNSRELRGAYTIKLGGAEAVAGQKTVRIELIPNSKEMAVHFPKFELWVSDETGLAVQQKIHTGGGDYLLATYTNMRIDPNIPESDVKLNLPRNVHRERPQK